MKPLAYHWDEMKIGPGATPFKTAAGWLHIYHGVFETMAGAVYRLGVALHDLADPAKILGFRTTGYCSRKIPGKFAATFQMSSSVAARFQKQMAR